MINTQHLYVIMFFTMVNTAMMALMPVMLQIFVYNNQAPVEDVLILAYFLMSCFVGVTTGILFGCKLNRFFDKRVASTDKYTIEQ